MPRRHLVRAVRFVGVSTLIALSFGLGSAIGLQRLGPGPARATIDYQTAGHLRPYSFRSEPQAGCPQEQRIDPVGILFWDKGQMMLNVKAHLRDHTNMWYDDDGSSQRFGVHDCRVMNESWKNAEWPTHYHMRWRVGTQDGSPGAPDYEPRLSIFEIPLGYYSLATPHIDVIVLCGGIPEHVVHKGDFDKARDDIMNEFLAGGHQVQPANWGNTTLFRQCNGEMSGSITGEVKYIRISSGDPNVHP